MGGFYEYNPIIYPRRLFVVLGSEKTASSSFDGVDAGLLDSDVEYHAVTFAKAVRKDTGVYGILVFFKSRKVMTVEVMAHEASHIVDAIEETIGMEHGGEASAYLYGWVVKSLDEARKNIGDFIETDEK